MLAEETHCGICGEWVDKTLGNQAGVHSQRCADPSCPGCVPHPMRAEVDEIVPVHRGGSPTERSNCRLSHRRCNQARNRKRPVAIVNREPYRTSRDWVGGLNQNMKDPGEAATSRGLAEPHHPLLLLLPVA